MKRGAEIIWKPWCSPFWAKHHSEQHWSAASLHKCCLSESNTKALHTLLHTDLHSFQSADCFLCCSWEPIRSGGGDKTANSNPDTDDMPMVSLFFLLQWQAEANTLQDGFICTEYSRLFLWSHWNFLYRITNMSVLANTQNLNIQFGN